MNLWIAELDNEALATGAVQGSEDAARAPPHRGIPRWEEAEEEQEAEEQVWWG